MLLKNISLIPPERIANRRLETLAEPFLTNSIDILSASEKGFDHLRIPLLTDPFSQFFVNLR